MKLGVLLFEGFELLDVFGPLEMFGQIDGLSIDMIAIEAGAIKSAQGPAVMAQEDISKNTNYEIILIPGGIGTRKEVENIDIMNWILVRSLKAKYIASVCTGSALLAKAGVLDGKKATTNKLAFSWVSSKGPNTNWIGKARWVQDGNIFSSAGVSAGIDMSLALIEEMWGKRKAESIADWAEYQWNSNPDDDAFAAKHGL